MGRVLVGRGRAGRALVGLGSGRMEWIRRVGRPASDTGPDLALGVLGGPGTPYPGSGYRSRDWSPTSSSTTA